MVDQDTELINIVYMGKTGQGKSTLCNASLFGFDYIESLDDDDSAFKVPFDVSAGSNSKTTTTSFLEGNLFSNKNGIKIRVIDTPGLSDSAGRDSKFIAEMIKVLKQDV